MLGHYGFEKVSPSKGVKMLIAVIENDYFDNTYTYTKGLDTVCYRCI